MEKTPFVQIKIDERVFIKDPSASGLGKKIEHSIYLTSLTEIHKSKENLITEFLADLVFKAIKE